MNEEWINTSLLSETRLIIKKEEKKLLKISASSRVYIFRIHFSFQALDILLMKHVPYDQWEFELQFNSVYVCNSFK